MEKQEKSLSKDYEKTSTEIPNISFEKEVNISWDGRNHIIRFPKEFSKKMCVNQNRDKVKFEVLIYPEGSNKPNKSRIKLLKGVKNSKKEKR